jgi:UDP-N-acetylmuramate dehydrogenase
MIIHNDLEIAPLLWYKIGGKVKSLLDCKTREDILEALKFIKEKNIAKIFVLGLGSNLIFTDEYFDGAVIRIASTPENNIKTGSENEIEVFSGVVLDDVIKYAFTNNLVGLEWAGGLPGTVGAGVRGNVGAYGGEIKDSLVSAEILDYSGDNPVLKTLTKADLQFAYRESLVKKNKKMIVISAKFRLKKVGDKELDEARKIYEKNIQTRKDRHPLEYPNCGSVFKNIREKEKIEKVLSVYPDLKENVEKKWYGKIAVASLIEKLGLKGFRIGDAQVSEKHALFIVNLGHAKAREVLEIIDTIQKKFQEKFGFTLEIEVEIVD